MPPFDILRLDFYFKDTQSKTNPCLVWKDKSLVWFCTRRNGY